MFTHGVVIDILGGKLNLKATRKKLTDIPDCTD